MPKGVLVIYTGGTIGSKPSSRTDPSSPQVVVPWEELLEKTPELKRINEERFPVDAYEEIEPLDSCNVGPNEWQAMAQAIADHYDQYNGFVILHGTDTMVYTATALSFMLQNLGKPVILTGAQRSAMVSERNDATQNVLTAVEFANPEASGLPVVPEVCIYFGGVLLRGNRTVKYDTGGYSAYSSPNLEPLGTAGDRLVVNERVVRKLDPSAKFSLRSRLETKVLPIFISPGIHETEMVKRQLETPGLKAAVVQAFGSGNIPTKNKFVELFKTARAAGVVLAAVSQCRTGPVELGIYETSAALLEAGFVAASDLTLEAAQVKLMFLLGNRDATPEEVELDYQRSIVGEQSSSLLFTFYPESGGSAIHDGAAPGRHRLRAAAVQMPEDRTSVERALLRLRGAKLVGPPPSENADGVLFWLFQDLDEDDPLDPEGAAFVASYRRWPKEQEAIEVGGEKGVVALDVTDFLRSRLRAGQRVSFTIAVATPHASLAWDRAELAIYARDI